MNPHSPNETPATAAAMSSPVKWRASRKAPTPATAKLKTTDRLAATSGGRKTKEKFGG
jgi:hypothetical protein